MTTFALVHGAWCGAWCWDQLAPHLEGAGHDVVAMDLPRTDGSAGFDAYADVVCDALADNGDDVVLVGHSLAGNTIPLVATRRPVRHLVYVCAVVPDTGKSVFEQLREEPMLYPDYVKGLSKPDEYDRTTWVNLELARELLFADSDEAAATAAVDKLGPQARYPYSVPFTLPEFPPVASTSVICTDDRIVRPEWSRRIARERLKATVVELPGDHSPMLARPATLAEVLLRTAGAWS